jgi:hypothetical protein
MRNHTILLSLLASMTASGCNAVECAEGTIERDGTCVPANSMFDDAMCGDNTHLEGDRCVPDFPPTRCEPGTTSEEPDENGVIVCKGMGGGTCDFPIACPTPTGATKQTVCGQLYDFEPGTPPVPLKASPTTTMQTPCNPAAPAASGPCALQMVVYDALTFGMDPTNTPPLQVGSVTINECGQFRLENIEVTGTSPYLGIGVDDAGMPLGATGTTVTSAVAVGRLAMTASKDVEAFIVKPSTAAGWTASGGPPLSGGIYAPVFRKHKLPVLPPNSTFEPQPGVTVLKGTNQVPANDFYFQSAQLTRTTIDPAATATGANGTALVTNVSVGDSVVWNGTGGLGIGCRWEPHAGAALSQFGGVVFIQVFRKIDLVGQTCND